jgi:hypothetical protein
VLVVKVKTKLITQIDALKQVRHDFGIGAIDREADIRSTPKLSSFPRRTSTISGNNVF